MRYIERVSKEFISIFLISSLLLLNAFMPSAILAENINLPASISDVSNTFSEKYCMAISQGVDPEKAGETAAKEIVRGLIFSPVIKQIMDIPKEELASSLSMNIYDNCGDDLEVTEQELNDYLVKFANRDRGQPEPKPFKPFGIG